MSDIAIKAENISKLYHIGLKTSGSLRETVSNYASGFLKKKTTDLDLSEFWALKDVSFEVGKGDIVGVIGRNGAGKSTLLKILSRITEPTFGKITLNGRVGSLLEVGTGFHPELSGRENIYLNGSILGMKRSEIQSKFEEIVEFSGIGKFIDTPVKRYSSGMYIRLAFSVAAHLEPDVMIVDEVLAVGDAEFQKKCLGKMQDVAGHGKTVLLVSHNIGYIRSLCKSGIYLKGGTIQFSGIIDEVIRHYIGETAIEKSMHVSMRKDRTGSGVIRISDIKFISPSDGTVINAILAGNDALLSIDYDVDMKSDLELNKITFGIRIFNRENQFVTVLNNSMAKEPFINLGKKGTVKCLIPKMPLMSGQFYLDITVIADKEIADDLEKVLEFSVIEADYYGSGFINSFGRQGIYIEQKWDYTEQY